MRKLAQEIKGKKLQEEKKNLERFNKNNGRTSTDKTPKH